MYNKIFNANVKRIMQEKDLNKNELAKLSGISYSFLADLIEGTGNPSLRIMETLAKALNVPLPLLLVPPDSLLWKAYSEEIPPGYELVVAILPTYDAYVARKVEAETVARRKSQLRLKLQNTS
jgi:transcriptional regulator with XRE-family HTH domain